MNTKLSALLLGVMLLGLVVVLALLRPEQPLAAQSAPAGPALITSRPGLDSPEVGPTAGLEPPASIAQGDAGTQVSIRMPESHELHASFDDLGPRLVAAGAIDYDRFTQTYERAGQALTESQHAILSAGSDDPIVIDRQNAYFMLNFFWALGLTNKNPILESGLLVEQSQGDIGGYASTGGWTLGRRPATELYASQTLISLTPEQQARLEEVASHVHRPCCNNHTAFADCNHGMAMLGLLELMAGQDASVEEMYAAARDVNAFWFPQQALEAAVFLKVALKQDYAEADPRLTVGPELFSAAGYRAVHQWLADNGLLEQAPNSGGSCGV